MLCFPVAGFAHRATRFFLREATFRGYLELTHIEPALPLVPQSLAYFALSRATCLELLTCLLASCFKAACSFFSPNGFPAFAVDRIEEMVNLHVPGPGRCTASAASTQDSHSRVTSANLLREQLRARPVLATGAAVVVSFAVGVACGCRQRFRGRPNSRFRNSSERGVGSQSSSDGGAAISSSGGRGVARAQNGQHQGTASLDCPVCLTELLLPRLAPCGHTLCTPCLVALYGHERRPACPVCRKRIKASVDRLPVNFAVKALVDHRVLARGQRAWEDYCAAEDDARAELAPCIAAASANSTQTSIVSHIRPAWNWIKWTVIIATELGAFLVSLKELLEAAPARARRFQRIV